MSNIKKILYIKRGNSVMQFKIILAAIMSIIIVFLYYNVYLESSIDATNNKTYQKSLNEIFQKSTEQEREKMVQAIDYIYTNFYNTTENFDDASLDDIYPIELFARLHGKTKKQLIDLYTIEEEKKENAIRKERQDIFFEIFESKNLTQKILELEDKLEIFKLLKDYRSIKLKINNTVNENGAIKIYYTVTNMSDNPIQHMDLIVFTYENGMQIPSKIKCKSINLYKVLRNSEAITGVLDLGHISGSWTQKKDIFSYDMIRIGYNMCNKYKLDEDKASLLKNEDSQIENIILELEKELSQNKLELKISQCISKTLKGDSSVIELLNKNIPDITIFFPIIDNARNICNKKYLSK